MLEAGTGSQVHSARRIRRSEPLAIVELPGDQFPDLEAAQQAARPVLAFILAEEIRRMLKTGELEIVDGVILPAEKS
jgi:hypothetical protein